MNRGSALVFVWVMVSAMLMAPALSQDDMTVVGNGAFDDPQRPPSVFAHDAHNETAGIEACNECHHVFTDGQKSEDESSEDQSCAECHPLRPSGGEPSLLKAYHANCKGCHKQQGKGPVMCGECHVRH